MQRSLHLALLISSLCVSGCPLAPTPDAGVASGDGGVPLADGGAGPLSCAEWEERVRALVVEQDIDQQCTEGLGGGCELEQVALTCGDGSTATFCVAQSSSQPDYVLTAACAIERAEVCTIADSCEGKECWCENPFNARRVIVRARELAEGCTEGVFLNDPCENEGNICAVVGEDVCVSDLCENTCQVTRRAACIEGRLRAYASEFPACAESDGCHLICYPGSPTTICEESPECAEDLCSPDCLVSVCDETESDWFRRDVPRTDIVPCE